MQTMFAKQTCLLIETIKGVPSPDQYACTHTRPDTMGVKTGFAIAIIAELRGLASYTPAKVLLYELNRKMHSLPFRK